MNPEVRLVYGTARPENNIQLTFLFPIKKWYSMFADSIGSILEQRIDITYEILVLFDDEDINNKKIVERIKQLKDNRILVYYFEGSLEKDELLNLGFKLSNGKWISLVGDNYVFLQSGLDKIGKILSSNITAEDKICCVSLGYTKLRLEYQNHNQLIQEINHRLSRMKDLDKMNLFELNEKSFWTYGGFGIDIPQRGSLYLREVFLKTNGFSKQDFPLEDVFLIKAMENAGEYKTYLSWAPFGIYVTLDSMFVTKEKAIKAFDLWMKYVEKKVYALPITNRRKRKKLELLKYKQSKFFINRHKSLNLSLKDFGYREKEIHVSKKYIISYILSYWKYQHWVDKQYDINERRVEG